MRIDTAVAARRGAVALSTARVALGVTALTFPSIVARPWVGAGGDELAGKVLGRALGARDLAIGLGALAALRSGQGRGWLAAGALSDTLDAAISVASWSELPKVTRWLVAGSAAAAALTGAASSYARYPGDKEIGTRSAPNAEGSG